MKKTILTLIILLSPFVTYSHEDGPYAGLINIYSSDTCDQGTGIAIVPIGAKVDCQKIHDISLDNNRAWAMKVANSEDCMNINDTTVKNICEAYNDTN